MQRLTLPDLAGYEITWTQRTPGDAPALAHELAAGLDQRARALGEQLTASPEPWLTRHLGVLAPGASPLLREDYTRRAATAAAYREAAGITDPNQAVSLLPHRGHPELEDMRIAAIRALEIRDEAAIICGMSRGAVEARALEAERSQAIGSDRQLNYVDNLFARANAAAGRIATERAEHVTRADYTARIQREAEVQAEALPDTRARLDMEAEP